MKMRLQRIQKLLKDRKLEFKQACGLELTNEMIGNMTGIPKATIDNLKNFRDNTLEDYFNRISVEDYTKYVNQDMILKLKAKSI